MFWRFMGVIYNTVQKKLGNIAQYHTRETTIFISPPPHYIEREIRATKYAENYFIINYIIQNITSFSLFYIHIGLNPACLTLILIRRRVIEQYQNSWSRCNGIYIGLFLGQSTSMLTTATQIPLQPFQPWQARFLCTAFDYFWYCGIKQWKSIFFCSTM